MGIKIPGKLRVRLIKPYQEGILNLLGVICIVD
jgi:hypothetical protein